MSSRRGRVSAAACLLAIAGVSGIPPAGGVEPVTCDGWAATFVGTPETDVLTGTPGADVIAGLEGDDQIQGLGGDDVICGHAGRDAIDAGPGDDRILGGDDLLDFYGPGVSVLEGDTIVPGEGDDVIDLGYDVRRASMDGGRGDVLDLQQAPGPVSVDLSGPSGAGWIEGWGTDTVVVQPDMLIYGSNYADTFVGSSGDDRFYGSAGDDVIDGGPGNDFLEGERGFCCADPVDDDRLVGGPGDDQLDGTTGEDVMDGGDGADQLGTHSPRGARMSGGPGDDDVTLDVTHPRAVLDTDGGPGFDRVVAVALDSRGFGIGRVLVNVRRGTVRSNERTMDIAIASFESYVLSGAQWSFVGSAADERLEVLGTSLAAWMGGGGDVVHATNGRDRIDGGRGRDVVNAYGRSDVCVDVEVRKSCRNVPAGS